MPHAFSAALTRARRGAGILEGLMDQRQRARTETLHLARGRLDFSRVRVVELLDPRIRRPLAAARPLKCERDGWLVIPDQPDAAGDQRHNDKTATFAKLPAIDYLAE